MYFAKNSLGSILATLGLLDRNPSRSKASTSPPRILGRHTKLAPLAVFVGGIAASQQFSVRLASSSPSP